MKLKAFCVAILMLGPTDAAIAHGGGLDRFGCHHDRKNGGYHCHRGSGDSSSGSRAPSRSRRAPEPRTAPFSLLSDRLTPAQRRDLAVDKPEPVATRQAFIPASPNPPSPLYNLQLAMPIMGQAKVIDGDTIEIGGRRLGLYGIDAFEPGQVCGLRADVPCGTNAAEALTKIINGVPLTCLERGADKGQRTLVVCRRVLADINAEMVRTGWAVADRAYSNDYANEEHIAMGGMGGAWTGPFQWPWEYRGERRETKEQTEAATQGAGCVFKAHVNSRGEKAYYVPTDAAYNGVRPDALFCSERAAILAGYLRRFR